MIEQVLSMAAAVRSARGNRLSWRAAQVAEWAGHSVHVLLKVYAKCIEGQDEAARRRIAKAVGEPEEETADQG